MELLLDTLMQTIAAYMWPLFRVASMLMVMVVFGVVAAPNTTMTINILATLNSGHI